MPLKSFDAGVAGGLWSIEPIWDEFGMTKEMHHVTAYKVVTNPIPGAVWLFGTALAALGLLARHRIAA